MAKAAKCKSPVEMQPEVQESEQSTKPNLAQFKKSWGFRRSTIAQKERMNEVAELNTSPPLVRKGRGRKCKASSQQNTPVSTDALKATCSAKNVVDDLEWSAPSSPATEESKLTTEVSAEESMDPSTWQNFGSAFHKAFSLLGGKDDSIMGLGDFASAPTLIGDSDSSEAPLPEESLDCNETLQFVDNSDHTKPPFEGREDDVVSVSSGEDDLHLKQDEHLEVQESRKGSRGGRGKARGRGRGRGRGKGKGRGRGRGKATEIQLDTSNDNLSHLSALSEPLLLVEEEELIINPQVPKEMEQMCLDLTLSPSHQPVSITTESEQDEVLAETLGQFDDLVDEKVEDNLNMDKADALCLICQQKLHDRDIVCCNVCQGWFHGDCVSDVKKNGTEFVCTVCMTNDQNLLQADLTIQSELEASPLKSLMQSPPTEGSEDVENRQIQSPSHMMEVEDSSLTVKTELATMSQAGSPVCIGPDCGKAALPGSVYCCSDCIMQHAAATMKNLTVPKPPKTRGRPQRKAAPAKTQRERRASKRLSDRSEAVELKEEEDGQESESSQTCDPSLTEAQATQCNASTDEEPGLATGVNEAVAPTEQAPEEAAPPTPVIPSPAPPCEDIAPIPKPAPERELPRDTAEKLIEPIGRIVSKQSPPKSELFLPQNSTEKQIEPLTRNVSKQGSKKSEPSSSTASLVTSPKPLHIKTVQTKPAETQPHAPIINRLHEKGAIVAKKTSFVIPKKTPPDPQSQLNRASSTAAAPPPLQKPVPVPAVQAETRNLLVPPAPSAPSSRPSQPNNQVRQSIQRSLVGILHKRVCDCEDLDMSESDVGKLIANIETEMFNIFRNTDSKYMNKYRTIMFNLKDSKNMGLMYRLVQGEISPFRLVRMSQKDMQAIQRPEPTAKEIKGSPSLGGGSLNKPEPVKLDLPSLIQKRTEKTKNVSSLEKKKNPSAPAESSLPKPEQVKLDLPNLIQIRTNKIKNVPSQEQKRTVPDTISKTRSSQRGSSAVPDILTCMLKDTTSEHHKHLFDLKCKICTGQKPKDETEEPAPKKKRVSEDMHGSSWRSSKGADSPLRAPPDSPELDSPMPLFTMGSPVLTIVESPASPTSHFPSSSPVDTPASPVMESPASPPSDDTQSAQTKTCMQVVIPTISTVTITRRDPRTAASRYAALTNNSVALTEKEPPKSDSYFPSSGLPSAPLPVALPSAPILPKSILMKPIHSADPRLYGSSSRNSPSVSSDGGTTQFLSKQDIIWKGFLNMLTIAKFVTKGYLVSGPGDRLKLDLPDTIQIGGRISPTTVWDYVAKLKTSVTKELCVIRFQPATDEEEVAYVSLFSYFSSRGRFGVIANNNRSIKDMYLFPLNAKEPIPDILQPLDGPGFEKKRPNLLLGLAIIQRTKRPGSLSGDVEEKRPNVSISTDPSWIPKPPSLYGSNTSDDLPYDPEIPISITPPGSPPRSTVTTEPFAPPTFVAPPCLSNTNNESLPAQTDTTKSKSDTPLQTILKQLFLNKESESSVSETGSTTKSPSSKKCSVSMVDPIVQQYGGKTTFEEIEEDTNDLDRPYDPEEEYDPAGGYGMVIPKNIVAFKGKVPEFPEDIDDDIAYDPEDETIFQDIQSGNLSKDVADAVQTSKPTPTTLPNPPLEIQTLTPAPNKSGPPSNATCSFPTGTVVISAETLTEQQRMLEELNRQIEEQKRQLKEQEEALRQQREAVGIFMAQFSASESSSASTPLPLSKTVDEQSCIEDTDKASTPEGLVEEKTLVTETSASVVFEEKSESQETLKDNEQNLSAGEVGDSDVAYDPEDESLFDEIQGGMLESKRSDSRDSAVSKKEHSSSRSRRHKHSPKRRGNRERGRHRSPTSKSHRRSPSRSRRRRDRDRHHKSERNSSKHRSKDRSGWRSQDSKSHSRSHRHRRSSSSHRNKHSVSLSPQRKREPSQESQGYVKNESVGDAPQPNITNTNVMPSNNITDVKADVKELPTFMEAQEQSICNNNLPCDLKELKLATELLLDGKLDSLIPLRELEPPTTDSPQSPDPEPQLEFKNCIKREVQIEPEINTYDVKVKIEKDINPSAVPESQPLNETMPFGLMEGSAVTCVKVELKTEETLFMDNIVTKELKNTKSHDIKGPYTHFAGSFEDSNPSLGNAGKDHQAMRESPLRFEKLDFTKSTLKDNRGEMQQTASPSPCHISNTPDMSSNEDNDNCGNKLKYVQQFTRHQLSEDKHRADVDNNRNTTELENIGSKFEERRNPNFGPVIFSDGQNFNRPPVMRGGVLMGPTRGEGPQILQSRSFSRLDTSAFEGNHGEQAFSANKFFRDHPTSERSSGNFEAPWNSSGPSFGGSGSRSLPFVGPGSHRGRQGEQLFGRGEEQKDLPIDGSGPCSRGFGEIARDRGGPAAGPRPNRSGFGGGVDFSGRAIDHPGAHRDSLQGPDLNKCGEPGVGSLNVLVSGTGGFDGSGFGRGGERRTVSIEKPGRHSGLLQEAGFDKANTVQGAGAQSRGFGGLGFCGFGEKKQQGIDREDPMGGQAPQRGDCGRPGLGRGGEHRCSLEGPETHSGPFGAQRGGALDSDRPRRGRYVETGFGRDDHRGVLEGPRPRRDGFETEGEQCATLDCLEHQIEEHEELSSIRDFPMDNERLSRGGFGSTRFRRGGEYQGPIDGPRTLRGGFEGPCITRGGEHHRERQEDQSFDHPRGPESHRGTFGEPGFCRGRGQRGGPMGNPGHPRGGHTEHSDRGGPMARPVSHRGRPRGKRGVPMNAPGPQRVGFVGAHFSSCEEHMGPPDCPEQSSEGLEETDVDHVDPMNCPESHRGGFGEPGFIRGTAHRGPMRGQGPQRRGFRGPGLRRGGEPRFGREDYEEQDFEGHGQMHGPGPHRGNFRGPRFGFRRGGNPRGRPIDGQGLQREGFNEPDHEGDWEHEDNPDCSGPGRAGFGTHEYGTLMVGPGPHRGGFGGRGFGRDRPMDHSGPQRESYEEPAFDQDSENVDGPISGPGEHSGQLCESGFEEPDFNDENSGQSGDLIFHGRKERRNPGHRDEPWNSNFENSEHCDFPMEGPGGSNFRNPGFNHRLSFRGRPMIEDNERENNRQGIVRSDRGGWETGPQPLRGRGLPRDSNQRQRRSRPGFTDLRPHGEFCGPGPSFRGLQNEWGDTGRGPGHMNRPIDGPRDESENERTIDDYQCHRPGAMRTNHERNEENRYMQDDVPDRPYHRQDRRSHERDQNLGRDIRDDQGRPLRRRRSFSREYPTRREGHLSGPKSEDLMLDGTPHIREQAKRPKSSDSVPGHTSAGFKTNPEEQTPQGRPQRLKPGLLPTPIESPLRPIISPRGRGRGRGGPTK